MTPAKKQSSPSSTQGGPAVDAQGVPAIDPTENVKALTEAANLRQDDLRDLNNRRIDAELAHLHFVSDLRATHMKEIRELESRRLDAIRQVDVTAVKTEADRALAAIQALAATTATNAENLRTALQNTAQTIAKQTSDTVQQITERIAALEKSSYEGAGKQAVADPMMAELVTTMKSLREGRATDAGKSEGYGNVKTAVLFVIAIVGFVLGALLPVLTK